VKAGEWTRSIGPDWFGCDVHHKTLGIVGMGRIGMALAQRAHFGFGMPILYNGVNEDGGRFHFGKLRFAEQVVGLFAQRQNEADEIP
jgi:lactate dehydrogenase-like 2-hydroxyacid dehydrogenase